MKTSNRQRSSRGQHVSKRRELAQHARIHSHTYINTVTFTTTFCAKRHLSYYIIWNRIFIFKVPEGGGIREQTGVPREKPRQPAR